METAVGVFDSRERAEQAMKELLKKQIPQESIVFLTRSETEAHSLGKEIGTYAGGFVGGAVGMTAGAAAVALALIPGIGQVFALGAGATVLLGYLGAKTGGAVGKAVGDDAALPHPDSGEQAPEDAALFVEVLKQGHSLIIVRTEFRDVAAAASEVLDRLGLAMQKTTSSTSARMQAATRLVQGVTIIDLTGRITVGEGSAKLRELVTELLGKGHNKVVLSLTQIDYVDSSAIGEMVRSFTTIRKSGGSMKLANVPIKIQQLLEATHLHRVFDIHKDEHSAIRSFGAAAAG